MRDIALSDDDQFADEITAIVEEARRVADAVSDPAISQRLKEIAFATLLLAPVR
jgi:hypothetical protein